MRATTSRRWGFPCFVPSPCACMPSPLPRRDRGSLSFNTSHDGGLPHILAGSAPASCLFEACSAFTQVTACLLAESPTRPFSPKASAILLPPSPLRLLPAGTTVAGRDLHPLKMHDFSRRTRMNSMKTNQFNGLIAVLARIDEQIVESDTLLLKSLTVLERHHVTDELAYLKIERRRAAAKLRKEN